MGYILVAFGCLVIAGDNLTFGYWLVGIWLNLIFLITIANDPLII